MIIIMILSFLHTLPSLFFCCFSCTIMIIEFYDMYHYPLSHVIVCYLLVSMFLPCTAAAMGKTVLAHWKSPTNVKISYTLAEENVLCFAQVIRHHGKKPTTPADVPSHHPEGAQHARSRLQLRTIITLRLHRPGPHQHPSEHPNIPHPTRFET